MKSYLVILGFVSLSCSLSAQNSAEIHTTEKTEPSSQETVQVPEILTKLNLLEDVDIDGYTLTFKAVESDGRCPEKVTCVWPGEAKVVLKIFDGTKAKSKLMTIPAMGFHKEIFTTAEHVVYLKNLAPYPITPNDDIRAYELLLKIEPKKL